MTTDPTALDLTGDEVPGYVAEAVDVERLSLVPDDRDGIELLRDLILTEYDHRKEKGAIEVELVVFTDALQAALRRLMNAPEEPFWNLAARVTGRRHDESDTVTYAKVGNVWVSPNDVAGRLWLDLVVEYDVLVVDDVCEGGC